MKNEKICIGKGTGLLVVVGVVLIAAVVLMGGIANKSTSTNTRASAAATRKSCDEITNSRLLAKGTCGTLTDRYTTYLPMEDFYGTGNLKGSGAITAAGKDCCVPVSDPVCVQQAPGIIGNNATCPSPCKPYELKNAVGAGSGRYVCHRQEWIDALAVGASGATTCKAPGKSADWYTTTPSDKFTTYVDYLNFYGVNPTDTFTGATCYVAVTNPVCMAQKVTGTGTSATCPTGCVVYTLRDASGAATGAQVCRHQSWVDALAAGALGATTCKAPGKSADWYTTKPADTFTMNYVDYTTFYGVAPTDTYTGATCYVSVSNPVCMAQKVTGTSPTGPGPTCPTGCVVYILRDASGAPVCRHQSWVDALAQSALGATTCKATGKSANWYSTKPTDTFTMNYVDYTTFYGVAPTDTYTGATCYVSVGSAVCAAQPYKGAKCPAPCLPYALRDAAGNPTSRFMCAHPAWIDAQ